MQITPESKDLDQLISGILTADENLWPSEHVWESVVRRIATPTRAEQSAGQAVEKSGSYGIVIGPTPHTNHVPLHIQASQDQL